jgi:hypothetical protein
LRVIAQGNDGFESNAYLELGLEEEEEEVGEKACFPRLASRESAYCIVYGV